MSDDRSDAGRARALLAGAHSRESHDPQVIATLAVAHALLAVNDRLGAVLDSLVRRSAPDTSQYAARMEPMERTWVRESELAEVQRVEADIDPDVAASNAALRRDAEAETRAAQQANAGPVGLFGQMSGEDG